MTPKTTREKWLVSLLPAFGVFFLGWLIFLRPAERTVTEMRDRVEKQGPISAKRALVAQAQTERVALEKAVATRRTAPAGEEAVFDRNWAMQQVSVLCAANGLSLDTAAPEPAAKLPSTLQEATPALTHNTGATPPQVWRIELTGNYAGILNLLDGLQKAKPLIVPLTISMQTGKSERQPSKWVLVLWL